MNILDFDLVLLVVGLLVGLAGLLVSGRTHSRAFGLAVGLTLLIGGVAVRLLPSVRATLVSLDPVAGPLVPLTGLWLTAVFGVMPRRHTQRGPSVGLLVVAFAHLALAMMPPGATTGVVWVLACAATAWTLPSGPSRRLALPYLVLAAGAGLVGSVLGGQSGALLVLFAVGVRLGIFPFHSWVVYAYERAPSTIAVGLVAPMSALALTARMPLGFSDDVSILLSMLLPVAALLTAGLAIVQRRLARAVGLLTVSIEALVLLGLFDADATGHLGGLLMWAISSLALIGLGLVMAALRSRVGTVRVDQYSGLMAQAPLFAGLFLVFALTTVGAPGTADFVSEDLVLHGALADHPALLLLYISAVSLQGYAMLQLFFRVFFGPVGRLRLMDALPRERVTLIALAVLLLSAGLAPQLLLDGWLPEGETVALLWEVP